VVRRIFAIVLIVLGLGTIGAAIASGTIWRPDDRVTLALPETPDVPVVISAPGVLDAVDNKVAVRLVGATADTPLVLAMARENDARAWVGESAHWEITGLTDWETLSYIDSRDDAPTTDPTTDPSATQDPSASAEATGDPSASADATEAPSDAADPNATVPNPSGSDLWVEELTGTGELEYSWTAVPGRWVMLVATDGTQPAPAVELTWDRPVDTPFVRPGIILGSVVLLLGLGLLLLQILADLEKRRGRREAAATAASGEIAPVVVAADGDRPLTRREIRLAEEARRRGRPARDTATDHPVEADATETIPAVPAGDASPEGQASEPTPTSDDAGELDAWVRTGAASPLLHEGERTTPADLDVAQHESLSEADEAQEREVQKLGADEPEAGEPAAPQERSEQPSWWRRRSRRDTPETPAPQPEAAASLPEPEPAEEAPAEPEPRPSGETDEIPAVGNDEPDAQEWGASWRQTWGLSPDEDADEPKEGDR
jgi:hypothetical protein